MLSSRVLATPKSSVYAPSANLEHEALSNEPKGLLAKLGVPPLDSEKHPNAFAEIRRIACRIRHSGFRSVGFVPADDRVGAIAMAIQIAIAMDQLHGATTNVLDANTARPQFSNAKEFATVPADALGFRTAWVSEHVTLSTPATVASHLNLADVAQVAEKAKRRYDYLFMDLTGMIYYGEHCSAYDLVDAVAVIAVANRTLEENILLCMDEIPVKQRLGVVLVG